MEPTPPLVRRTRTAALAVLSLVAACGGQIMPGAEPPAGNPEPTPPPAKPGPGKPPTMPAVMPEPGDTQPPASRAQCKPGTDPAPVPLLKLTTVEYRNTVRDLVTASGVAAVATEVKDLLASIPDDSTLSFRGHDNRISLTHVLGYYNVAAAVAEALTRADRLAMVAGACAATAPLAPRCLDDFLGKFGRRALRRPLTPDETAELQKLNDGQRPPAEVFRAAIVQLLNAPAFLYHMEVDGAPVGGKEDVLQLTPWEVASRLSYAFWQTMPDDALLAAAADGSLATDAGLGKQLDRLWADPRTRATLWQFWNEWLRLESFTGFASSRPGFKSLAMGEDVGKAGKNHYGDMVTEVRALVEMFTFTKKGTLADLLTTDVSVTKSADLARLYGVVAWDGMGEPPKLPAGTRAGLLQRGALLVSSLEQTNPFHRGALLRRTFLCDPLPQPDPTALPPGALDPPPVSNAETTRQRFQKKVEGNNLCIGCHAQFNDLGYVMEAYDALGRFRQVERVFDEKNGMLLGELPLDTGGVPRIDLTDDRPVKSPAELNQRIVESKKVDRCLASNYFSYVYRHPEAEDGADACVVEELQTTLSTPGMGLEEAFKRIALNVAFRRRKVGQ